MAGEAKKKKRKVEQGDGATLLTAADALHALRQSPSCAPSTLHSVLKMLSTCGPTGESFAEGLLANGFLTLVPSILEHSSRKGVIAGIEVLGALSVSSLSAHRKVVNDRDAIRALAEILKTRRDVELLIVACHAVIDLHISPFGCEALQKSGIMSHLLHLLCWTGDLSKEAQMCLVDEEHCSESFAVGETNSNSREARKQSEPHLYQVQTETLVATKVFPSALHEIKFCEEVEELITTTLTALSGLIRHLGIEKSSRDLCREVLVSLRRFWLTLLRRDQMLLESIAANDDPRSTCSGGTRQLVARCVVQLAMELDSNCSRELSVQQGLFENTDLNPTLFFEQYWEQTAVVVSRKLPSCLSAFSKTFTTLAAVSNRVFAWFVNCPPAPGDQLDSRRVLESIESTLGEPMIYGQDIRIVKTVLVERDKVCPPTQRSERTVELHYNGNGTSSDGQRPRYVHPREILEAIDKGYTVAIKGMELRCSSIADMADCLARQFGQPSVGVNLYITPANAQGLDLHYDDHCVFVCQLVGRKTWNVYPPQSLLPRLYSSRALNRGALNKSGSIVYDLREGEVLYIPRGFPHKAHCGLPKDGAGTNVRENSEGNLNDAVHSQDTGDTSAKEKPGSSGLGPDQSSSTVENMSQCSLHLTFGVEVEPPFEWEGLVHTALRLWAKPSWQTQANLKRSDSYSRKESCIRHEQLCEGLLHVAINLLGEKEVALRKACMIAAEPSCPSSEAGSKRFICEQGDSVTCDVCDPISCEYFQELLALVANKASCDEALTFAQNASGPHSGGLEWLRHVTHPCGQSAAASTAAPVILELRDQLREVNLSEIEMNFSNMKAEFGKALLFHQASQAFKSTHRRYRTVRKKLTNGILALHANALGHPGCH